MVKAGKTVKAEKVDKVEKKEAPVTDAPVEEVKKVAEKPAEKTETKTTEKKTETKKAEKKAPAKKAAEVKEEQAQTANLYLQYGGKQFSQEEIVEKAKLAAVEESGLKRASSIKSIDIYCKPEEHAAYYVANGGKIVGRIDL